MKDLPRVLNLTASDSSSTKTLTTPAFVLSVPFSLSTEQPNNASMRKLTVEQRRIDLPRALSQWTELYRFLTAHGLVYLLPSTAGLQDQVFVANLGIVLPHVQKPIVVVANFRSEPRRGETQPGVQFFNSMGFDTVVPTEFFEGEADLKFLRENIYLGGHGLRTSAEALEWFRREFAMQVIPIRTFDEHLYHLDCITFPIDSQNLMLCTSVCDPAIVREIGSVADIIDVSLPLAYRGITNIVRVDRFLLIDSPLKDLKPSDALYAIETEKIARFEAICSQLSLEPVVFNLSEFYKSGAMLSCMVMHLNYPSRR